jgi:membrane associated rhomboid family serine protease
MLTLGIIALTAIVSLYAFNKQDVFDKLCLHPYEMHRKRGDYFRLISVGFVHADIGHLLFNMLTLYFFGTQLENYVFTETQYVLFYASALAISCLSDYVKQKENSDYRACGASGAVSAVVFALVLFQPWGIVYLKFIIPIYFILYAFGYLLYSYYMSKQASDRIAHGVHMWGALYGIAFTLLVKPESLRIFLELIQDPPFLKN